jgi:cytosine/uracil/thiamine/allantoin permease
MVVVLLLSAVFYWLGRVGHRFGRRLWDLFYFSTFLGLLLSTIVHSVVVLKTLFQ